MTRIEEGIGDATIPEKRVYVAARFDLELKQDRSLSAHIGLRQGDEVADPHDDATVIRLASRPDKVNLMC